MTLKNKKKIKNIKLSKNKSSLVKLATQNLIMLLPTVQGKLAIDLILKDLIFQLKEKIRLLPH